MTSPVEPRPFMKRLTQALERLENIGYAQRADLDHKLILLLLSHGIQSAWIADGYEGEELLKKVEKLLGPDNPL